MKNLGIFLTGAITGAAIGVLLAPNSGEKTRKLLAKEVDSTMQDWEKTLAKTSKEMKAEYNKKLEDLTKHGKEWVNEAKEAVKLN
ncbi:MAG: YtxH domain-containing protein [Cytophagales bacterium]